MVERGPGRGSPTVRSTVSSSAASAARKVGQRAERPAQLGVDRRESRSSLRSRSPIVAHPPDRSPRRRRRAAPRRSPRTRAASRRAAPRARAGPRGGAVELEDLVEARGRAPGRGGERRADGLRLVADQSEVENPPRSYRSRCCCARPSASWARRGPRTSRGTARRRRVRADDDVLRHDLPGEAAVADRVEDGRTASLRKSKFGALGAQAALDRGRRAHGADERERVAARAVGEEQLGAGR